MIEELLELIKKYDGFDMIVSYRKKEQSYAVGWIAPDERTCVLHVPADELTVERMTKSLQDCMDRIEKHG